MLVDVKQVLRRYDGEPITDVTPVQDKAHVDAVAKAAAGTLRDGETVWVFASSDVTLGQALVRAIDNYQVDGEKGEDKYRRFDLCMRITGALDADGQVTLTDAERDLAKNAAEKMYKDALTFGRIWEALSVSVSTE